MSLVNCPDCGHQVSDRAARCPDCAAPLVPRPSVTGLLVGAAVLTVGIFITYWRIQMAIMLNVVPAISGKGVMFGLIVTGIGIAILSKPLVRWARRH